MRTQKPITCSTSLRLRYLNLAALCLLPLGLWPQSPATAPGVGQKPSQEPPIVVDRAGMEKAVATMKAPQMRRLNPASFSLDGRVIRRSSPKTLPKGLRPPPPIGGERVVMTEIPQERTWQRILMNTPGLIHAARMREGEEASPSAADKPIGKGKPGLESRSEAVRLASPKLSAAHAVLTLERIPVKPDTLFQFRVKGTGDIRLQLAEYDEDGEMIGRQWTNPVYLSDGGGATYAVQTTQWTHWIVAMVDNPGFEETEIVSVSLEQGHKEFVKGGLKSE